MTLPPGPKLRALTSVRLMKDSPTWVPRWRDRHGDPYTLDGLNGVVVVTGRPELIRQVIAAPTDTFKPFAASVLETVLGQNSVLLTHGERHKKDRKLLMPPFHGDRMRAYGEAIRALTRDELSRLPAEEPFRALDLGQRLTLAIIVRVAFGVEDDERLQRFCTALNSMMEALTPSFLFIRALQRGWYPPWRRFSEAADASDALLLEQVHKTRGHDSESAAILDLMLRARYDDGSAMSDDDVLSQLRTLLAAGHETTAISLSWLLYAVHRHPEVKARLLDELSGAGDDVDKWMTLPYLRAVCDESLRLWPPLPEFMRTLIKPFTLGDYELPVGASISANMQLLHGNEELYPAPHEFRPERFLERTFGPHEYAPFGGGNRRCLGAAFAHYELRIALATLLTEGAFELLDEKEPSLVRRNITMAPDSGVRLRKLAREPIRRAA